MVDGFYSLFSCFLTIFPYCKSRGGMGGREKEVEKISKYPMLSSKLAGQILFHITHICLPIWGKGNFSKHSAYQSSHSHTGSIKNERTTKKCLETHSSLYNHYNREWRCQHLKTHTGAILLYLPVLMNHWPKKNNQPLIISNWRVSDSGDQWISSAGIVIHLALEYVWTAGSENEPTVQLWCLIESE